MLVIHTDGSSKNGYSCWCFKSSLDSKCTFGILHTMNIAAVETIAVINALIKYPPESIEYEPILIISDSLITVRIIQQQYDDYLYSNCGAKYYRQARNNLRRLLIGRDVDAVHVNSKNTNTSHIEVDHVAKTELDKYLKRKGIL